VRRLTLVPAPMWGVLFLVGTVAALAYGAGLLLHVHGWLEVRRTSYPAYLGFRAERNDGVTVS
jgi:hypothetical protein